MEARELTHQLGGSWRNGSGSAACPVCQSSRRKGQNALSIGDANGKLLLHCFKHGCSFEDVANAVNLPFGDAQIDFEAQREREAKQAEYSAFKLKSARNLWSRANPIKDTKAEQYLRGRGITCDLPGTLRFVPDLYHAPSESRCMAMIGKIELTSGVHRTFLDKRGNRLAKSAKMMLGPCAGGAVRLSKGDGPLVVCEGIETGLSLLSGLLSERATVWAALSTSGIRGLALPPKPHKLVIASDGDTPGRAAAHALAERAQTSGWQVSLLPAPDGFDWNDILTNIGGNA